MKYLTFTRVKVYDNSFLISDYRDKRYKKYFWIYIAKETSDYAMDKI